MQLNPGERSILAYFPGSNQAQEAGRVLRQAGFNTMQIDRISRFGVNLDDHVNNPINSAVSGAGVTVFSDGGRSIDRDERALLAADPSVSGYGDAGYGIAGGNSFLLTLVTSDERVEEAVAILKQQGAQV